MPTREPLATRKNAMLSLAAFLVICTAWWYAQQPGSPTPPPPPGDTTVVVDPPDTTTPPTACSLNGGSGNVGSSTCQSCAFTPPGPTYASVSASCVEPPVNTCNLIGGTGDIGDASCQPCPYNPPGGAYATTAVECVAPPPPQVCTLFFGSGTVGSSTCQPCPYNPPGQLYATQAPTCVAPVSPPDTTPTTNKIGPATIAAVPRSTPTFSYTYNPTTVVTVSAGGNLQAAINAATPGTEIRLAAGATFTGNYTLPVKANPNQLYIDITTDVGLAASRMTPVIAASKGLAKVCTNNSSPAFGTVNSSSYYRLTGLEICSTFSGINMIVRLGDSGGNGQTSMLLTPHHFILDRNYIHGRSADNIRRCVLANVYQVVFHSNWISGCHDGGGDSQAILNYNGGREQLIENNYLEAGHEILIWGAADPADSSMVPADITVRRNHFFRPNTWRCLTCPGGYTAGIQWQVKNLIESKNVQRLLIEDNVFQNDWSDAQQYAFNFKSENQNCSAPYTQTADLTMRYNLILNVGSGWNLIGKVGACAAVPAARYYIHDNWIKRDSMNVYPYTSEGVAFQLSTTEDLIITHNTVGNAVGGGSAVKATSTPLPRLAFHSNVFYHLVYGVKGDGQNEGVNTINTYFPSSLWMNNMIIGASCGVYPATTLCPSAWPTVASPGYDGKAIGADTVAIKTRTAGVVVSAVVPLTGIIVNPGESIQAAVDANPPGSIFILKAGTHVAQSVAPKVGDYFHGEAGTILDGQNTTQFAFKGWNGSAWVNTVIIRYMKITRYNPPAQNGAIWGGNDQANGTSGWIIDSVEANANANLGIRIGNRMQVLRSNLHHNGTINIGGVGRATIVDGISSTFGNQGCPHDPGFESGGSKFAATDSLIVRNSVFSDNCGVGLWLDINNRDYELSNNLIERNYREGISVEVSHRGKVFGNTLNANGWPIDPFRGNGWLWDAGIGIHASDSVEVYNNILNENFNGIVIIQQLRQNPPETYAPPGGYFARDVYFHDNTVYQRTTAGCGGWCFAAGAVQDVGDNAVFTSRNNRWENNHYFVAARTDQLFAWMNVNQLWAAWNTIGHDSPGGTIAP